MWDREGQVVAGIYCDRRVEGVVNSSRVKYGGAVSHRVSLDSPIRVYGEDRTVILVENLNINRVLESNN